MKIKRFHALNMQEAIRAIKADLGPDAVILSSKRIKKGGMLFGLFGQSMLEVAAAVDVGSRNPLRSSRKSSTSRPRAEQKDNHHEKSPPGFQEALVHSLSQTPYAPQPQPSPSQAPETQEHPAYSDHPREPKVQGPQGAPPPMPESRPPESWESSAFVLMMLLR